MNQADADFQSNKTLITDVFRMYKERPVLWDQKDPNFHKRDVKDEEFNEILEYIQAEIPDVDSDLLKYRIQQWRTTFRREYRKVKTDPTYKSNLWYYDLLLFTVGEEPSYDVYDNCLKTLNKSETNCEFTEQAPENEENARTPSPKPTPRFFWTKEMSVRLIQNWKQNKILYVKDHPNYSSSKLKREVFSQMAKEMSEEFDADITAELIRKKYRTLRDQFYKVEHKRRKCIANNQKGKLPTIWYYNLIKFLLPHYDSSKSRNDSDIRLDLEDESMEEEEEQEQVSDSESKIKMEEIVIETPLIVQQQTNGDQAQTNQDVEDLFDISGKHIAQKIRDMTPTQAKIANQILRELLFHGQMENLSSKSRLAL